MDHFERTQNPALKEVTGQTSSTPPEALRLEAGIPSYRTVSKTLKSLPEITQQIASQSGPSIPSAATTKGKLERKEQKDRRFISRTNDVNRNLHRQTHIPESEIQHLEYSTTVRGQKGQTTPQKMQLS